jgi:hypothetical protein
MNFGLYDKLIRKPTLIESFNKDYQKFVSSNHLWKGNTIPLNPIWRNYMQVAEGRYNKSRMIQDLWNLSDNQLWVSKDGKAEEWTSITLKSLNGGDQSFLTETELGSGENNKYKYTKAMDYCSYFRDIVESLPTDIYLVRVLKLKAGARIKFHTDEVVFKKKQEIIRCHLPIITNEKVKFQIGYPRSSPAPGFEIWDADVLHERHLDYGHLWYTNVNTLHGVVNEGDTDRYHLVIDMRPNPGMLKKIYG